MQCEETVATNIIVSNNSRKIIHLLETQHTHACTHTHTHMCTHTHTHVHTHTLTRTLISVWLYMYQNE